MEDYPRTVMELEARFSTEEACRAYLWQLRWPGGFRCPRCGHGRSWAVGRGLYECCACGRQTSVTAGAGPAAAGYVFSVVCVWAQRADGSQDWAFSGSKPPEGAIDGSPWREPWGSEAVKDVEP